MNWHWFVAPGSALYLLPLAAIAGIAAMARSASARRPVMAWWLAIAAACLLTAASKIAFYGWGTGIRAWDLTCFSGHTVISFAVWPVVGMLLTRPSRSAWRIAGLLAGLTVAGLIAYSRIPLRAHPLSEVIAGVVLGGAAGLAGLFALRRHALTREFFLALALIASVTVAAPSGYLLPTLPSERWLAEIGASLAGREKPITRKKWRDVSPTTISQSLHLRG